jgi:aryl-alcohol dehydrogenase-like predicted oxidoreductase
MEQPEYNMLKRERVEAEYAPLYRKHGLGLTVFSPLRRGILTGKYNSGVIPADSRAGKEGSWFREEIINGADMLARVARLAPIAEKLGCTQGQLAIAWSVRNEYVSNAIVGATSVEQMKENLVAVKVVPMLTKEVLDEIEGVLENKPKEVPWRFT